MIACTPGTKGGYKATKTLLAAHPEVDALMCFNDLVAVGALQACCELNVKVPDDLAVVGFDDIELAKLVTPALTTLRVSRYDLGKGAIRMLLGSIRGEKEAGDLVMKPQLIVRASAP